MHRDRGGCLLGWLVNLFGGGGCAGGRGGGAAVPRVMVNKYFVSDAERNFFQVLRRVVGGRGHVLAQVSLRQLLFLPGTNADNPGRSAWQNKLAQRSVDFVVCDASTLRPLVVVELDDATHGRPERQTRDDEVRALLDAAKLPRIGVLAGRTYDTRELQDVLRPYLPA